jgi:hypothetical protein
MWLYDLYSNILEKQFINDFIHNSYKQSPAKLF